ncbi:MAG: AAA family ATPase [Promethearchaeota archaeon]
MVKKFPATLEQLKKRRDYEVPQSELLFFKLLDDLSDEWTAWHSIQWNSEQKKKQGEADFLVFHPQYGYVVIEAKGGPISYKDGIFYSNDFDIGDPFDQARKSMYHIKEFYFKRARTQPNHIDLLKDGRNFPLNFSICVFFPDTAVKRELSTLIQFHEKQIIDATDIEEHMNWVAEGKKGKSPLEINLIRNLNVFKKYREKKPAVADFFCEMISADISNYICLKKHFDLRERELERVNLLQDYLLKSLAAKKRCFFKGSAGSGKTFVAMKKALMNHEKNIRTLILCYNSELRASIIKYLKAKTNLSYNTLKKTVKVKTIHKLLSQFIRNLDNSQDKRVLGYKLHKKYDYAAIADYIKGNPSTIEGWQKFDAILVDEAQDFDPKLWNVLQLFLRDENTSYFYIFFDEAQSIFIDEFLPEKFGLSEHDDLILLNKNLRNTIEIADWVRNTTHLGNYEELSGINGLDVDTRNYASAEEALSKAVSFAMRRYVAQEIESDKIVILSYYKLKTLTAVQTYNYNDYVFYPNEGVNLIEPQSISEMSIMQKRLKTPVLLFKTITSFKGLEGDVIFLVLPEIETFRTKYPEKFNNFMKQLYVGASRAKFKLYFFTY